MVEDLGPVTLKSGETVRAAAIRGPDADWCDRITRLLVHKGDPWNWQNTELLTRDTGLDAWFYVLHRAGAPFADIMTAEFNGVGIFGHVWTEPADRCQGAASALMHRQMAHFHSRGGRALFLNTTPGSPAFELYRRHGFAPVEPGSGTMSFTRDLASHFAPGPVRIEPVNWRHWPMAPALFTAAIPGLVRCAPLKLSGRKFPEEELLPFIQHPSAPPPVLVATTSNGAVVGLAAWQREPLSPGTIIADVFCHPNFWPQGEELFSGLLSSAPAARTLAYADSTCPDKSACLARAGFRLVATAAAPADLLTFERAAPS